MKTLSRTGRCHLPVAGILFAMAALLCVPFSESSAQPNLNFKRVTVNWPTIELYFAAGCDGNPLYNLRAQDFRLFENGMEVQNFSILCPDPTARCAISVALVFDASGSMSGAGNAGAKLAGLTFVDLMDGVQDEASIFWFNQHVYREQAMTTLKPLLYASIDALPASGGSAAWDACYAAVEEVVYNGVNQCKAVVLLADGQDDSSNRVPAEIISFANQNNIRIYCIGLGSAINATELEMIALLTGGRYYQTPNANQLSTIYQDITTIIYQSFQECVITYDRGCADGTLRNVELQLNYCGGMDVKTKTYRAPLDSTTFTDLRFEFDDAQAFGGEEITIPLRISSDMNVEVLHPFSLDIHVGSCVRVKSIATPSGTLLEGVPPTVTPFTQGVMIQTGAAKVINGNGALLELTLVTNDPPPNDTLCCDIQADNATMFAGCRILQVEPGTVCVFPRRAKVDFIIDGPRTLAWDTTAWDYDPNPFEIVGRYFNTGSDTARNGRYTLEYSAADFALVSPTTDTQSGTPANIAPGEYAQVSWMLAARHRSNADSLRLCIRNTYDNHPQGYGCIQVYRPASAPPALVTLESSGGLTFCEGDSVQLSAPDGLTSYDWSTGDTTRSITVRQSGSYHCAVRLATGQLGISDTVTVAVLPLPQSSIALNGSNPLCDGDTLILDAGAGFVSYHWNTGEQTRLLTVTQAAAYHAEITDANGCAGLTDTVQVTVLPAPLKPVISRSEDDLHAPAAASYRWFADGQLMAGETGQDLHITQTGSYQVEVTNAQGCSALSDPYMVTVLDVEGEVLPSSLRIAVYPDPARDAATLKVDIASTESATVWLTDLLGRRRHIADIQQGSGSVEIRLDLANVPVGAYHIVVQTAERTVTRMFIRK